MSSRKSVYLVIFGILGFLITIGYYPVSTLQCVVCDSYTNGRFCADWDRFSFITNCSQVPRIDSSRPMACRKIYQTVDQTTVLRQCTNVVGHDGCIDRVGAQGVRTRHCHCSTDLCNSSLSSRRISGIHVIVSSAILFVFAIFLQN
ncbi:uncharacterized protein DEA37_0010586 [Paragonimus westermani]|uniref:Protein quiver n=1 Tax=Paragonimus westermani TaxID=34504 RepID=A0A5J4NJT9_9TREM|nr:uncharacterized protein DEA37_0010586 [Paragonimus westermani]